MKLRLSRGAQTDITNVALAYRAESVKAAQGFVNRVDEALDRLRSFPRIGSPRDDLGEGLRIMPLRPFAHLLIYRITNSEVFVTRVIDGRRDLKALLDDE